jgi:mRNA-degrading endonuclease RelE of RelBE toxin-antitoxin system
MASFRIDFKPSVEKDLLRLPADIISRSMEKIAELEFEPFHTHSIKISGSKRLHRLRKVHCKPVLLLFEPKHRSVRLSPPSFLTQLASKSLMALACAHLTHCDLAARASGFLAGRTVVFPTTRILSHHAAWLFIQGLSTLNK